MYLMGARRIEIVYILSPIDVWLYSGEDKVQCS